jgi:hypothetical protein
VGLVAKGVHRYSDLPLGVSFGYLLGTVITYLKGEDLVGAGKDRGMKLSVAPPAGTRGGEVQLVLSF